MFGIFNNESVVGNDDVENISFENFALILVMVLAISSDLITSFALEIFSIIL